MQRVITLQLNTYETLNVHYLPLFLKRTTYFSHILYLTPNRTSAISIPRSTRTFTPTFSRIQSPSWFLLPHWPTSWPITISRGLPLTSTWSSIFRSRIIAGSAGKFSPRATSCSCRSTRSFFFNIDCCLSKYNWLKKVIK